VDRGAWCRVPRAWKVLGARCPVPGRAGCTVRSADARASRNVDDASHCVHRGAWCRVPRAWKVLGAGCAVPGRAGCTVRSADARASRNVDDASRCTHRGSWWGVPRAREIVEDAPYHVPMPGVQVHGAQSRHSHTHAYDVAVRYSVPCPQAPRDAGCMSTPRVAPTTVRCACEISLELDNTCRAFA